MLIDLTCLVSTIKNTSGAGRYFSCIPPHGGYLEAGESLNVFGNILEAVNRGGNRLDTSRLMTELQDALQSGDLVIVQTPAPLLLDEEGDVTRMLITDAGKLALVNPCWDYSLSQSIHGTGQFV